MTKDDKPWDEATILTEFTWGDLKFEQAIERLIILGYTEAEAAEIVHEWADDLGDDKTTILSGG